MVKKVEEKKEIDETKLNEVLNMFKEYLEKADKKLSKELEEQKTDEEIYEERKEEILEKTKGVADRSKRVIVCAGDGGIIMSGSTLDKLNIIGNIINEVAVQYNVPIEVFEDIINQVYEGM